MKTDLFAVTTSLRNKTSLLAAAGLWMLAWGTVPSLKAANAGVDSLNVAWTPVSEGFNLDLTWDLMESSFTVTGATLAAINIRYFVYSYPGYTVSSATIVGSGSLIWVSDELNASFGGYRGVRSFVVIGRDIVTGYEDASPVRFSHFIHKTLSPQSQDIARYDTNTSQNGQGQQWTFEYKLQADAYMSIEIFPATATFTKNASGYWITSSTPIKRVLDNTPRSFQMVGNTFTNKDFWDLRNSSGTIAAKGLYYALFTAKSATDGSTILDTVLKTVPNDTIRLYNITASPITDAVSSSQIGFTVNADCRVKVLVCSPGTKFALATTAGSLTYLTTTYSYIAGDNIPLDPTTLAVDGNRILRVMDFNVVSGAHSFSWNGANQSGTNLSSGLYTFAISAADAFDNHAVDAAGNNYAQWGTIPINRSASQPFPVIVAAVFPAPGGVATAGLRRLAVSLAPTMDGVTVDGGKSAVTLTGPDFLPVSGVQRWDAGQNKMEFEPVSPLMKPGSYRLQTMARGSVVAYGDFQIGYESLFTIEQPQGLQDSYVSPSPIKGVESAEFRFSLSAPSEVRLRIFNLLGDLLYERSEPRSAGSQNFVWNVTNGAGQKLASGVYLYRLEAEGREVVKKFMVVQ